MQVHIYIVTIIYDHLIQNPFVKLIFVFHAADDLFDRIADLSDKLLLLLYHGLLFINAVDDRLQLGNFPVVFGSGVRKFLFGYDIRHIEVNQLGLVVLYSFDFRFQLFYIRPCGIQSDNGFDNGKQVIRDFLSVEF